MAKLVGPRQLELLLDFMEEHRSLALAQSFRGKEGSALSKKLWSQCAAILNSDFGGAHKSAKEWKRYYNQYKCRIKQKSLRIKEGLNKNGGGPAEEIYLSPLEKRLIDILGGCRSPLPVRQNSLDALTFDPSTEEGSDGGGDPNRSEPHSDEMEVIYIIPNKEEADIRRKGPLRVKQEKPLKRQLSRRASSPKEKKDIGAGEEWKAAIKQSSIDFDKLTQAINRHASAMEKIAGAVNRFVDLYAENLQQAGKNT